MKPIILLHGALGSAAQFGDLGKLLEGHFEVHLLNLPGHGGGDTAHFSIPSFARFVEDYILEKGLERPAIFGYSMGGYVALYLAKENPELLRCICTLATKFHWDEATAAKEVKLLNPEAMETKVPLFAEALKQRHQPSNWKAVVQQTATLLKGLGENNLLKGADYTSITTPVLVMLGDRDKMVSLEETVAVAKALPFGELAVLPNTPHPWEGVDAAIVAYFLQRFFK